MAKNQRVPNRPPGSLPEAETHKALLEAGYKVIAAKGYHSTTIDDVCNAASVSRATFYFYFSNKKQLFMEIMNYTADDFFAESTPPQVPQHVSYYERILAGNLGYFRAWERYAPFLEQMFSLALVDQEVRKVYERNRQRFESRIEKHIASLLGRCAIPKCSPPLLAEIIVNLIETTTLRFFLFGGVVNGRHVSIQEMAEELSAAWCRVVYGQIPPEIQAL